MSPLTGPGSIPEKTVTLKPPACSQLCCPPEPAQSTSWPCPGALMHRACSRSAALSFPSKDSAEPTHQGNLPSGVPNEPDSLLCSRHRAALSQSGLCQPLYHPDAPSCVTSTPPQHTKFHNPNNTAACSSVPGTGGTGRTALEDCHFSKASYLPGLGKTQ